MAERKEKVYNASLAITSTSFSAPRLSTGPSETHFYCFRSQHDITAFLTTSIHEFVRHLTAVSGTLQSKRLTFGAALSSPVRKKLS